MAKWPRERLAFTGLMLKAGHSYRNGLGDVRGPLRQIGDTFLDEYGCVYRANGHQYSHHIESAGNLKVEVDMTEAEFASEALQVVAEIKPLLAGRNPAVQGAVLADLVSLFVAGHAPELRAQILELHVKTVRALVPASAKQIRGG